MNATQNTFQFVNNQGHLIIVNLTLTIYLASKNRHYYSKHIY